MKLVEVAPNRWRVARDETPPARSDLPLPNVISDTMPAVEQVDGKVYTSKSAFRAVGRSLGLTEVGNERPAPKRRAVLDGAARREGFRKAIAEHKAGRRPAP